MKSLLASTFLGCAFTLSPLILAQDNRVVVTVENFNRAESDLYFTSIVQHGGFGKFDHARELSPIEDQQVIRLNRDTLYSSAIFDLEAGPVQIRIPETDGRFISMHVFNQDHYTVEVNYGKGDYELTREKVGTRYVAVAIRTLVNPMLKGDLQKVHSIQDQIVVKQQSPGKFEIPAWDSASQNKVRNALLVLADTLPDRNRMFGNKQEVEPVRFLLGTASAWGGNPDKDATYLNVFPEKNDGKTLYRLEVGEVPVKDFWSITIYNAEGYMVKNDRDLYSLNNLTAKKNADGSVSIQFGGEAGDAPNVLPIMPGWNYMVRLYRPAEAVLKGEWTFPEATIVK